MPDEREARPIEVETAGGSDVAVRDRENRERYGRDERGLSLDPYSLAADLLREETGPNVGELGHVETTMWLLSQVGTHGGTNISDYPLGTWLAATSVRTMMDGFVSGSRDFIEKTLGNVAISVDNDVAGLCGELYVKYRPNLKNALAKEALYELNGGKENDFDAFENLSEDEAGAYLWYEKEVAQVKHRANKCGSLRESLNKQIESRLGVVKYQALLDSGLVNGDDNNENRGKAEKRLEDYKKKEVKANKRVAIEVMTPEFNGESAGEWYKLIISTLGAVSVFNNCYQWLTNQSDLAPIGRLWENQGRMVELHPSYLKEMSERYPSFGMAFRGIAALGSGKYAIAMNGKIYPSGAYGLGYVDNATGRVVDIDVACDIGVDGKKILKPGFEWLKKNQIWVEGKKVDITVFKKNGSDIVDILEKGKRTAIRGGKATIDNKDVEVYTRNILYNSSSKDVDVDEFNKKVNQFTKIAVGGDQFDVDLGVALARDFYESTMLSNWNGIPRDSKGRPYYVEYKGNAGNNPERDYSTISSDPNSKAVRTGIPLCGWDEASLYPYWVGDWGKLTQTRVKQLAELTKGRSHGLYALLSYLPENLVKPMLSVVVDDDARKKGDFTYDILEIVNGDVKMERVFDDMKSVERFKTFWLGIARGTAVYEFISSYFIGEKDVTKADQDLLTMMMQPRNFEKITKMIDLSVFYTDPLEAVRLRVNIVTAALESVANDLYYEEFLTISNPGYIITGKSDGKLKDSLSDIKSSDRITDDKSKDLTKALKQLAVSRFVGDEDDVYKIVEHILNYKRGKINLGFTRDEFLTTFGGKGTDDEKKASIKNRMWKLREDRRSTVVNR